MHASALPCLSVVTLNVAVCVVYLGRFFEKSMHKVLEFKAKASVNFFNAACLCVHVSLN